jgi:hypothetical protein
MLAAMRRVNQSVLQGASCKRLGPADWFHTGLMHSDRTAADNPEMVSRVAVKKVRCIPGVLVGGCFIRFSARSVHFRHGSQQPQIQATQSSDYVASRA